MDSSEENIKIFIANDIIRNSDAEGQQQNASIIKLRHPRTEESTLFLLDGSQRNLLEIVAYNQKCRSWMVDDVLESPGKMQMCTPFDPLFILISYMSKMENVASPLDQILCDSNFPDTIKLLKLDKISRVHLIADKKGSDELNAWKFNEEKTLKWLSKLIDNLLPVLKKKLINVKENCSSSSSYVLSSKELETDETYRRYAHGILSEYLSKELSVKLLAHLGLPLVKEIDNKRKGSKLSTDEIKRMRMECALEAEFDNAEKATKVPVRKSAKQNALLKAATKNKSITSFFGKK